MNIYVDAQWNGTDAAPEGFDAIYQNLTDAVNNAATNSETVITIAAGSYNDNIAFFGKKLSETEQGLLSEDKKAVYDVCTQITEQKGAIKFVAQEPGTVTLTGSMILGYYRNRSTEVQNWSNTITFENITFDQELDNIHSLYVDSVGDGSKGLELNNCTINGSGEYGIGSPGNNNTNSSLITNCEFNNMGMQIYGNFGSNLLIEDCIFNDSRVNVGGGNSVTIEDCIFNNTLTNANLNDSFYCVRSNDTQINIKDTQFNIDSTLSKVATDQSKWGILWQRNTGATKWNASNIEINLTNKAMKQTELLVNKNGTTSAANEADRILIDGLTSSKNNIADLLAKSEGILNANTVSGYYIVDDGTVIKSIAKNTIYVDASMTSSDIENNKILGINTFQNFVDALKNTTTEITEIKVSGTVEGIMPSEGINVTLNNNLVISGTNNAIIDIANESTNATTSIIFQKDATAKNVTISFNDIVFDAKDYNIQLVFGNTKNESAAVNVTLNGNASISAKFEIAVGLNTVITMADGSLINTTNEALSNFGKIIATGSLTSVDEATLDDRQINVNYIENYGTLEAKDTYISTYQSIRVRENSSFTVDNTKIDIGRATNGTPLDAFGTNPVPNQYGKLMLYANGVMTLKNGSQLNVLSPDSFVRGTLNVNASEVNFGAGFTNEGTINVSSGELNIGTNFITYHNQNTINMEFTNKGNISLENSSLNVKDGNGVLNNESTITLDGASCITIGTINNTGTINIDVADTWNGVATVIDAANGTNNFGNVVLDEQDAANGLNYFIDENNGDLIIHKVDNQTIYVDSAFTGAKGDDLGDGKFYNLNAFSNILDIVATDKTTNLEIAGGSYTGITNNYQPEVSILKGGITEVTAKGTVDVTVGNLVFETTLEKTIKISGNFVTTDSCYVVNTPEDPWYSGKPTSQNGHIRFDGAEKTIFELDGNFTANENIQFLEGTVQISADSTLTISNNYSGHFNVYTDVINYGNMTVTNEKSYQTDLVVINSGNLTISGNQASLTTSMANQNTSWQSDIHVKNGALEVLEGATVDAAGLVKIAKNGSLLIQNSTFSAGSITNSGSISIIGTNKITAEITGNTVSVAKNAVFEDSYLSGSFNLAGNITLDNSDLLGNITGSQNITITGISNLALDDDSSVKAITIIGETVAIESDFNSVAITGKNATLTANVDAFDGNKVTKVQLALTDLIITDGKATIDLDIDNITNIISINNVDIKGNANTGYSFAYGDLIYSIEEINNKIEISQKSNDEGQVNLDNISGSLDNLDENYVIETKEGTSNLTVSKGEETAVGAILQNENGGKTNLTVNQDASLTVNGDVESINKLTTKNGSELTITGNLEGNHSNTTISIGKDNDVEIANIDLKGGKNTLSIGSGSSIEVKDGDISKATTIKLDNGIAANDKKGITETKTTLEIAGDIVTPGVKNTITLGNLSELIVDGGLNNSDLNVGTTLKAGKKSTVSFGDEMRSVAAITMGDESEFTASSVIGTVSNDKYVFGKKSTATIGDVDMKGGKNTFQVSAEADVDITGSLANVTTLKVDKDAKLSISKDEVNNIVDSNLTGVNATITLAQNAVLEVAGDITSASKMTIAKEASATIEGNFDGIKANVSLAQGAELYIAGNMTSVNKLTIAKEATVMANAITGTEKKDSLTINTNASLTTCGITDIETINISKGGRLVIVNDAEDIYLDNISGSWKNGSIYDSQYNFTEEFTATGKLTLTGSVYKNEYDYYLFDVDGTDSGITNISFNNSDLAGITISLYRQDDNDNWEALESVICNGANNAPVYDPSMLTAGKYLIMISKENADFIKNNTSDDNKYSITITK